MSWACLALDDEGFEPSRDGGILVDLRCEQVVKW